MILTKEQVIKDLNNLIDLKYQEFSKKLTPDTSYKIMGIRVPVLRQLAKKYQEYDVSKYLENVDFMTLEECQLYGIILNNQKWDFDKIKPYLEAYIPVIDSWAICDIFCAGVKINKKDISVFWDFITSYIDKEREFEVRFGLVMILEHYISYERLDEIISIIENINIHSYYVQMASAWLLSICFIKYPEYMLSYLQDSTKLDKFTYNKTLSKITDSYRVSKEYKEIIKKMHIR